MARRTKAQAEGDDSFTDEQETEATIDEAPVETAPPILEAPPVTVLLLGEHVYLPEDPTTPDWAASRVTVRYDGKIDGRRARVTVHPTLADFLQTRGQAEILD